MLSILKSFSDNVRPGLIWNRRKQREIMINEEVKKVKMKPISVIQNEKREEGMKTAISSENKGFQLLQKMGYQPGQSLGKSGKFYCNFS